jgi:hypothetical protein
MSTNTDDTPLIPSHPLTPSLGEFLEVISVSASFNITPDIALDLSRANMLVSGCDRRAGGLGGP